MGSILRELCFGGRKDRELITPVDNDATAVLASGTKTFHHQIHTEKSNFAFVFGMPLFGQKTITTR